MNPLTPTDNLILNIKTLMKWRGLSQQAVADAMEIQGFAWYRKTVNRVIAGERPVRVDELYGLALVLETTVGTLLSPDIASEGAPMEFPRQSYGIGVMPPIHADEFAKLLDVPVNKVALPVVGVRGWSPSFLLDGKPQWKSWVTATVMTDLVEVLANSGWKHVDEFLAAHPNAEGLTWRNMLVYIEDHPNPRREVPMR